MSDEESALLRAIFAQPEEDTPRLVYADWLEEHGEPERAGYIRLAVSDLSHTTTLSAGQALCVDPKWKFWRPEWARTFVELFKAPRRPKGIRYTLLRGFVASVTCSVASWREHHAALRDLHPITAVRLTDTPDWTTSRRDPQALNLRPRAYKLAGDSILRSFTTSIVVQKVAHLESLDDVTRPPCIALALIHLRFPGIAFHCPTPADHE